MNKKIAEHLPRFGAVAGTSIALAAFAYWLGKDSGAEPLVSTVVALLALGAALWWLWHDTFGAKSKQQHDHPATRLRDQQLSTSLVRRLMRVAFVDDEGAPIAESLRARGYNVFELKTVSSVSALTCDRFHIVYLDVSGVAVQAYPVLEGAGLADELRRRFLRPFIILYSAVSRPPGTDQSKTLRACTDGELSKADEVGAHVESLDEWGKEYFSGRNLFEMVAAHTGKPIPDLDAMTAREALAFIRGATQNESTESKAIRYLAAVLAGSLSLEAPP